MAGDSTTAAAAAAADSNSASVDADAVLMYIWAAREQKPEEGQSQDRHSEHLAGAGGGMAEGAEEAEAWSGEGLCSFAEVERALRQGWPQRFKPCAAPVGTAQLHVRARRAADVRGDAVVSGLQQLRLLLQCTAYFGSADWRRVEQAVQHVEQAEAARYADSQVSPIDSSFDFSGFDQGDVDDELVLTAAAACSEDGAAACEVGAGGPPRGGGGGGGGCLLPAAFVAGCEALGLGMSREHMASTHAMPCHAPAPAPVPARVRARRGTSGPLGRPLQLYTGPCPRSRARARARARAGTLCPAVLY